MRTIALAAITSLSLLLAACASDAPFIDHEFGMATKDAFDRHIVYKDYAHAGKSVEGLAGIHAEPVMNTYQKTFSEGFTKENFDITDVGSESE